MSLLDSKSIMFLSVSDAFTSLYYWAIDNVVLFIITISLLIYIITKLKKVIKTLVELLLIPLDAIKALFQKFRENARILSPMVLFRRTQDLCYCWFCKKGGGKSSTVAAVTCWAEEHVIEQNIINAREKTHTIMYDFPYFEEIDKELKDLANESIYVSSELSNIEESERPEHTYDKFKPMALCKKLEPYYADYVEGKNWAEYSLISYRFMMEQYIIRTFSLMKRCYVYSYTDYTSNYTGHRNYQIDTDALQIKYKYKNRDYLLSHDAIVNYGDITCTEKSNNKYWQANVAGGMDLALRVWRQKFFQSTIFNCDCQEFMTLDPSQRRLIDVPVEILDVKDVLTHPIGRKINNTINDINEYVEAIRTKFGKPSANDSIYRRIKRYCLAKESSYKCDDWKKTTICIYNSVEDAEKNNLNGLVTSIYLRTKDCYGQYDTFEFSALHDVLTEESVATPVFSNPKETYEQKKRWAKQYLDPNGNESNNTSTNVVKKKMLNV